MGVGERSTPLPHLQDARGTGKERVKLASGTLFCPPLQARRATRAPMWPQFAAVGGSLVRALGGGWQGFRGVCDDGEWQGEPRSTGRGHRSTKRLRKKTP